jgi:glycerol-3-phosphate acyltransferase PlsY
MLTYALFLLLAYLIGSIPTAVIVARLAKGVDIRSVGDGNMGARNVALTIGLKYGILVSLLDIAKGVLAVLLVKSAGLELPWQVAAAFLVTLGHDYPILAGFKGGQGLAAITGSLWMLMPLEISIGIVIYLFFLIVLHKTDLGASLGLGFSILLAALRHHPAGMIACIILLILTIPAKQALDTPRRRSIHPNDEQVTEPHTGQSVG